MEKSIESMFIESAEGRKAMVLSRQNQEEFITDECIKIKMSTTYGVIGAKDNNWDEILKTYTGRDVFAIYNDDCIIKNVKTDMEHRIHLKKRYGVLPDDYANLIRGYMKPGQIIFYKTNGFKRIEDIPESIMRLLITAAIKKFGFGRYEICNTNNGNLETLAYCQH